jgi:ribosome-binding factor A
VIQEELSVVVPREVKDPRVPSVTFTRVEVTSDGSQATVYFTILGGMMGPGLTSNLPDGVEVDPEVEEAREAATRKQMKECLDGLTSAAGYLRRHFAKILHIRHIPTLIFREDKGLDNTLRVQELLKKIGGDSKTE